jgi:hypothetical protein
MTTEGKILYALDKYYEAMKGLDERYRTRQDNLPVNEAGEVDARAVLEVNAWYIEQQNKIKMSLTRWLVTISRKDNK